MKTTCTDLDYIKHIHFKNLKKLKLNLNLSISCLVLKTILVQKQLEAGLNKMSYLLVVNSPKLLKSQ